MSFFNLFPIETRTETYTLLFNKQSQINTAQKDGKTYKKMTCFLKEGVEQIQKLALN